MEASNRTERIDKEIGKNDSLKSANNSEYFVFPNESDVESMVLKFCGPYDKKLYKDEQGYLSNQILSLDRTCLGELYKVENKTLYSELSQFISKEEKILSMRSYPPYFNILN